MIQHGGHINGGGTAEVCLVEEDVRQRLDEEDDNLPTLSLKLPDEDDPGCAGDIDRATDSETADFPSEKSRTPTLKLELRCDKVKQSDGNCFEQIWREGTLQWGERKGDDWIEHWQTQEGLITRFGTKRGRDLGKGREWQERWEETGPVTRIEKRVTQTSSEGQEIERWIERSDISDDVIRESCVGENKLTGRHWRTRAVYQIDNDKVRHLKSKELEEIFSEDPQPTSASSGDHPISLLKRRIERTCLQPGNRVLHTRVSTFNGDRITGFKTSEEDRYEDCITGSQWGSESRWLRDETCVKEWSSNPNTGAHERRDTIFKKGKTSGIVISYDPVTNETYKENWGKEKIDETRQTEWSSKWRQRDGGEPWGDYIEKIEIIDPSTESVIREEQRNEKWWFENNNERFSEQWTVIEERKDNRLTKITKTGHNEYGLTARESWDELYELVDEALDQAPSLQRRRIEKVNSALRSIAEVNNDEEHHFIEDKKIGQTDIWHLDKRTGAKWGNKDGRNAAGVFWHEQWSESEGERWLDKSWKDDQREWGERSGWKGPRESWTEKWSRDATTRWNERSETDVEGNMINRFERAKLRDDGSAWESHYDSYGETCAGEKWAHKQGFDEFNGEWEEKWNERPGLKTASKRGRDPIEGNCWFEAWSEHYDISTGAKLKKFAKKEGANATGDSWMETWTEEGAEKYAQKNGRNSQQEWREEWHEDGDGAKWCRKWASNGQDDWAESWVDNPSGSQKGIAYQNGHPIHHWSIQKD